MSTTVSSPKLPHPKTKRKEPGRVTLNDLIAMPDAAALETLKRGLPSRLVRELAERLELPVEAMAGPLQLTLRTLHRRLQEGTLALAESERILALGRILARAIAVLGDETKAVHWLHSRIPALDSKTPLDCAWTWIGIRQVETELGRIEDGVYS
ncbi:MAG: DUF2384 domain-containing protein [Verrucomicrobia bacterium]|nr:DUF2384 domain-containing protein [Verrucomicrobiota bacterium]